MSFMRDRTERIPEGFRCRSLRLPVQILPTKLFGQSTLCSARIFATTENCSSFRRGVTRSYNKISRSDLKHRRTRSAMGGQAWLPMPWKNELLTLGENAWCERMWIEDCGELSQSLRVSANGHHEPARRRRRRLAGRCPKLARTTNRAGLLMSVDRGIPEVSGRRSKRRGLPLADMQIACLHLGRGAGRQHCDWPLRNSDDRLQCSGRDAMLRAGVR